MDGYIYVIVLGVLAVCASILAGQFARVGQGKAPSLSLTVRALMLITIGFCLVFFLTSAMACDKEDEFRKSVDAECDSGAIKCLSWEEIE